MMRATVGKSRRIVVKVGTSLLAPPEGGVNSRRFTDLASDVIELINDGREVVMVSSGAVGLGQRLLELDSRPTTIPDKQALAAVGQIDLCRRWDKAFGRLGHHVGQILVTHVGLADRERFLNARHTMNALLALGVVPVVNENDSVATEELRFGDNDQLAALVVNSCEADLLVLLTVTDGVMDEGGERIPEIRRVKASVLDLATRGMSDLGTGGMRAKLVAARTASRFGAPTVIADGRRRGVLQDIVSAEDIGTLIWPAPQKLSSRKHWIAYSLKARGTLHIDQGAARALRERGRSLLPAGVVSAEGRFGVGDLVRCVAPDGMEVARGLISYNSTEIEVIKGHRTSWIQKLLGYSNGDEIIHRNDLVVL